MTRDAVADYIAAGERFVGIVEGIETAGRDRILGDLAITLADLWRRPLSSPRLRDTGPTVGR